MTAVHVVASDPDGGCTGCGSPDTVTLDSIHGRRCAACPPLLDPARTPGLGVAAGAYVRATLPAGPYRPDLAADMIWLGRADAAFAYLGAYLRREIDRRFDALRVELRAGWEAADTARQSVAS